MTSAENRVVDGRAENAARAERAGAAAKGNWGVRAAFLGACRGELALAEDQASAARVVRAADGAVRGPGAKGF